LKAASVPFNIDDIASYVHLTNYSVQKYNENFSKFEHGNEVSFKEFQVRKLLIRISLTSSTQIRK
jgi:hypothetical protein